MNYARFCIIQDGDLSCVWYWPDRCWAFDVDGDYEARGWWYKTEAAAKTRQAILRTTHPGTDIDIMEESEFRRRRKERT